jgi:hypothetical protein
MRLITGLLLTVLVTCSTSTFAQKISFGEGDTRRCDGGAIKGSASRSADPEENVECKVLGKIFCMVEQHRSQGEPADVAISFTADWLRRVGQTGSHLKGNFKPVVSTAAAYIYAQPKTSPWDRYYYAVYTCGLEQRLTDPAGRQRVAQQWDSAAAECQQKFPGAGDGYGNEGLRKCLRQAMQVAVATAKGAK